jgi:hypothetical protein
LENLIGDLDEDAIYFLRGKKKKGKAISVTGRLGP